MTIDLAVAVALISTAFAAIATIASFLQVTKVTQSNEVNVYIEMRREYGADDMRQAVRTLAAFWRANRSADIPAAFLEEKRQNPDVADALRGHARLVTNYFCNAARLRQGGFISAKLLRLLIDESGLNVFYAVATPIALVANRNHPSGRYSRFLQRYLKQHGEGMS